MQSVKSAYWTRLSWVGALWVLWVAHASVASDVAPTDKTTAGSGSISIAGAVEHPRRLTLADLKNEPATTESVSLKTGKGMLTGSYTGVLLWTLLQQAVIKLDPGAKNDVIRHTIVVSSSDGYSAVLSTAEISPELGDDRAIIAYAKDGQPLADKRGFARLIVPTDKAAARAISGVATITVR